MSVPGDGLWGGAHISGSSKAEPDLPDGQFHAAGVRRWGHEGEVFLQVIWLHPFILQSIREQDSTGRWEWLEVIITQSNFSRIQKNKTNLSHKTRSI